MSTINAETNTAPLEDSASAIQRRPPLLEVKHLAVRYLTEAGAVPACEDVNLTLHRGEILGIAGESACGKSTLLTAITRLQRVPAVTSNGSVIYHPSDKSAPVDLVKLSEKALMPLRWSDVSIVMQSAMAALNPVMRLGAQFTDVLQLKNRGMSKKDALDKAAGLLDLVGIAGHNVNSFPHQLSGGMRQRSLIALAMASDPELIVMDEPTTAVDVVMQRKILSQVMALQEERGFAIMFVTHDLSLLLEISDRIAIMYAGRIVEIGSAAQLYRAPQHPYTQGLRNAFPPLREPVRRISGIAGTPPNLLDLPPGCSFAPRCSRATAECLTAFPPLLPRGTGHVACIHPLSPKDEATPAAKELP
ncbi:MAG: ABC transporter ATP-binding protein [Propionibacteriaceae bacterium]|nr:ABC transporter ATP-binding protein [Propionibacteriaceae bacterium]